MDRRKRVLLVLFVPSADRGGNPVADQSRWVTDALGVLGTLYGGATAYPESPRCLARRRARWSPGVR